MPGGNRERRSADAVDSEERRDLGSTGQPERWLGRTFSEFPETAGTFPNGENNDERVYTTTCYWQNHEAIKLAGGGSVTYEHFRQSVRCGGWYSFGDMDGLAMANQGSRLCVSRLAGHHG